MYIIRGIINGAMCYVCGGRDNKDYTVRPSSVGIHAVTLFEQEQDAKNAINEIKHGTAVLLVVTSVDLSPPNAGGDLPPPSIPESKKDAPGG